MSSGINDTKTNVLKNGINKNEIPRFSTINCGTNKRVYERIIVNIVEAKFVNNRYTTLITIEFEIVKKETIVNISSNHKNVFESIERLESSTIAIIELNSILNRSYQFPISTIYT